MIKEMVAAGGNLFLADDRGGPTISRFLADYWRRKVLHAKCPPALLANIAACRDLVAALGASDVCQTAFCRILSHPHSRQVTKREELLAAFARGETVQVRNLERLISPESGLYRFAHSLAIELAYRLDSITLFLSPAEAQAFGVHTDPTEIVTIQLGGSKIWHIARSDSCCEPQTHSGRFQPIVLEPGCLLYVPSGVAHWVRSSRQRSASMALVFRTP
jgi:ribosomal protein L16 Arg81 hydroxylase